MESAVKEQVKVTAELNLLRLLELQRSVSREMLALQQEADEIDAAIRARVANAVADARNELQKFEGTVHAVVDGVEVISNVPKRVEWDSDRLDAITGELVAMDVDPADYIEAKLSIPEKKYAVAPEPLRTLFDSARTLKHGKETFKFTGA